MPVTAKLSKAFYERLGEDVANELVDWFDQMDAIYRSDLRELNELNFARFDAKLEQRVAALDAKLEQRTAEFRTELQVGLAAVRSEIAQCHSSLLRWNFVFWAAVIGAIVGLR